MMRAMRAAPLALALALAALCAAVPPAARAEQDETGPNFELAPDTRPDHAKRYAEVVQAFREAKDAKKDARAKVEGALKKMVQLRKEAGDLPPLLYYMGIGYQWIREYARAREVLEKAIAKNPKFHQALVELGDVRCWEHRYADSLVEYDRAIAIAPRYGHAYLMRSMAKLRMGDAKGALADAERAEKLAKEKAGAKYEEDADPLLKAVLEKAKHEVEGPSWGATTYERESANYIVRTPVSQAFADDISEHAELIYKTYTSIFPKIEKEKRKFVILAFADAAQYHANGGPPQAAGHYDPIIRKLHIYKHENDADTKIVLYHEGFHQFIHDYLDDAPQWFDEGLGDFFGPTEKIEKKDRSGKVISTSMRLRANPWRLELIQLAIRRGRVRPWRELMLMSHAELYDPEWIGIHYAQAWSIIYFLIRGGAAPDQPAGPHFKLLNAYFTALRKGDGEAEAYRRAFGGQNVAALEEEWKAFILRLKPGD